MKKSTKNIINILLLALMFAVLYLLEQHFGRRSMLITVLKKGAIYALIAVSMNLLNGFTGLFFYERNAIANCFSNLHSLRNPLIFDSRMNMQCNITDFMIIDFYPELL